MDKVDLVLEGLKDRQGFDQWWHEIDDETQQEIKDELKKILKS